MKGIVKVVNPRMVNKNTVFTVAELAEKVSGQVIGDSRREITGVSSISKSTSDKITFAENNKYIEQAVESNAGAIIVPVDMQTDIDKSLKTLITVKNPRLAYAIVSALFAPEVFHNPGIHTSAVVSRSANIGRGVSIHPRVVIDDNAVIGDNTILAPGVYVGRGARIGDNTTIHPNVVIEYDTVIGSNVIIHGGTVIGSDGYGFVSTVNGHYKIPQLGNVIIEDDVEIGANVTVDRGTSGPTVIGQGTKIDNLVQIAHNVNIGPECLIIAQVGIAGSAELGKRVTLAGKTGVVGHIKIDDHVTIASNSIVTKPIPAGVFYSGNPAQDHKAELKEQAARRKLPELLKRIKRLEKEIIR
ncbi:MAG: UDP-3-O-(3-hydroxymyristoyl)glucosamine N-acyltransferase [Halanaerobiales bacterium]